MLRVTLFLTEICNKTCPYCDIPKLKKQRDINEELFYKYFPIINKSDNFKWFTITGGEPGLVNPDIWEFLFSDLNHLTRVNTNGVFFDKGYFDKYYDHIYEIGYHPVVDLGDPLPHVCADPKIKIYMPYHKLNYHLLEDFINRYPKNELNLIPYIRKFYELDDPYVLDDCDYMNIYTLIKDKPNVNQTSKDVVYALGYKTKSCIYQGRLLCQNSNIRAVVNFVNGTIHRCPESITLTDTKPINTDNIEKMLQQNLFERHDKLVDEACLDCMYFTYFLPFIVNQYSDLVRSNMIGFATLFPESF